MMIMFGFHASENRCKLNVVTEEGAPHPKRWGRPKKGSSAHLLPFTAVLSSLQLMDFIGQFTKLFRRSHRLYVVYVQKHKEKK